MWSALLLHLGKIRRPVTRGLSRIVARKAFLLPVSAMFAVTVRAEAQAAADTGVVSIGILDDQNGRSRFIGTVVRGDGSSRTFEIAETVVARAGGAVALNGRRATALYRQSPSLLDAVPGAVPEATALTNLGAALRAPAALVSGTERWVIIGCKFADRTTEPKTVSAYLSLMQRVGDLFAEMSRGIYQIQAEMGVTWFTMPNPLAVYIPNNSYDAAALERDCLAAAEPSVDFSRYTGIVFQYNGNLGGYSFAYLGTRTVVLDGVPRTVRTAFMSDWASHKTYGHELGHTMGWSHTGLADDNPYSSVWDIVSQGSAQIGSDGLVHTLAMQKYRAGWIPASETRDASAGVDTILLARSTHGTGGPSLVTVRNADGTSYVVETRGPVGMDYVPGSGVLVHRLPPSPTSLDAYLVPQGTPTTVDALWAPGMTFTDPIRSVAIKVISAEANGAYRIAISRTATCDLSITPTPAEGGSVALTSGSLSGLCDRAITAVATPAPNFGFVHWRDANGTILTTSSTLSLTLSTSKNIQAVFSSCALAVTQAAGGNISVVAGGAVGPCTRTVTVQATPEQNYAFAYWIRNAQNYGSTNPWSYLLNVNETLTAKFSPCRLIMGNPSGGAVTLEVGPEMGTCGRTVQTRATPNAGYRLKEWRYQYDGNSEQTYVNTSSLVAWGVVRQLIVTPIFTADTVSTCTVAVSASAGGSAAVTAGGVSGACGRSVTVTATANSGFGFAGWTDTGATVATTASYTFTLSNSRSLVAAFAASSCTLTLGPTSNGSVSVTTGSTTGECGRSVTIAATPAPTFAFSSWTEFGSNVTSVNPWTIVLNSNRTISAVFTAPQCTVSLTATAGGIANISSGEITGACGRTVTVSATPNSGFVFSGWTQGSTSISGSATYTFTVNTSQSLTANFTASQCTLTLSAPTGGAIAVTAGSTTGTCGRDVTLSASPNASYTFSNWQVNGATAGTQNPWTFTLADNRTIGAVFAVGTCALTVSAGSGGSAAVSDGGANGACGRSVTVAAIANAGFAFTNWTRNGSTVSTSATYAFAISTTQSLVANFVQTQCTLSLPTPANGTATVSTGGASGSCGRSVTVAAAASSNFSFGSWMEGGVSVSTENPWTFPLTANRSVTAVFNRQCRLQFANAANVQLQVTGGSAIGDCGRVVGVTATPSNGWKFGAWTESAVTVSTINPWSFTLSTDRTLSASVTPNSPVRLIVEGAPGRIFLASNSSVACNLVSGVGPFECSVPRPAADQFVADPTSTTGFVGWSGACTGRSACGLPPADGVVELRARFVAVPTMSVDALARDLLGLNTLTSTQRALFDQVGNADGVFNLGDLLAHLDRTGQTLSAELARQLLSASPNSSRGAAVMGTGSKRK